MGAPPRNADGSITNWVISRTQRNIYPRERTARHRSLGVMHPMVNINILTATPEITNFLEAVLRHLKYYTFGGCFKSTERKAKVLKRMTVAGTRGARFVVYQLGSDSCVILKINRYHKTPSHTQYKGSDLRSGYYLVSNCFNGRARLNLCISFILSLQKRKLSH